MKKLLIATATTIIGVAALAGNADMMKRYDIKSAKIEFKITKSGNIMGMVQTKTVGKKRLIFDNYGAKELTELSEVTKTTTNGNSKLNKIHTLKYINGGILYSVNFKHKKIVRMKNQAMAAAAMFGGGKSVKQTGIDMLKKMGGKKIGTDKVLGYACDVWDMMGIQQCIYKGITLRVMSDIMGLKSTEVAIKIAFNVSLNKDNFKLPNFPITDKYGKVIEINRADLDKIDAAQSAKALKNANDAKKAMAAGMKALAESGANISSGKKLTPQQKEAMKKAVMASMGGKKGIFERQKQNILKDFRNMPKAKECFRHANNTAQANACEEMIDSEDPQYHTYWDKREKAKLLKKITKFEKAMPCIKKAQNFNVLRQCMPR